MTFTESLYHGFRRIDFKYFDRDAIIIFPNGNGNRHIAMKTEYFDAFPDTEIALLKEGFTLTYIQNRTRWGTDDDCKMRASFIDYVAMTYDLIPKITTVGMSCGGFHAVSFASRYPEKVEYLYIDAPLLSMESFIHSWEIGAQEGPFPQSIMQEYTNAYGFTTRGEVAAFADEPIHRLHTIVENKIPVGLVYGDDDHVVLKNENAECLISYLNKYGSPLKVWCKHGCDHHPHGLADPAPLIADIKANVL